MYQLSTVIMNATQINQVYKQGNQLIHAVNGINISILKGEMLAITGNSGAGKSSLLRILGCQTKPAGGQLWFDEQDVLALSDNDRAQIRSKKIGYVFQQWKLFPALTAKENIILPLHIARLPMDQRELMNLVDFLDIGECLSQFPHQLSGGQQQRVAIARALITRPKIVFADEPTGALDSENSNRIIHLFKQICHAGTTIVMVTHNESLATQCSRIIQMRDGKFI